MILKQQNLRITKLVLNALLKRRGKVVSLRLMGKSVLVITNSRILLLSFQLILDSMCLFREGKNNLETSDTFIEKVINSRVDWVIHNLYCWIQGTYNNGLILSSKLKRILK